MFASHANALPKRRIVLVEMVLVRNNDVGTALNVGDVPTGNFASRGFERQGRRVSEVYNGAVSAEKGWKTAREAQEETLTFGLKKLRHGARLLTEISESDDIVESYFGCLFDIWVSGEVEESE